MSEVIAFSGDQQAAIVGHVLRDPSLLERLNHLTVTKEWFIEGGMAEVFDYILQFKKKNGIAPRVHELLAFVETKDPDIIPAFKDKLARCGKASNNHGRDLLFSVKLVEWARARIVYERVLEVQKHFNSGSQRDAEKAMETAANELRLLEYSDGALPDNLDDAIMRVQEEEARRLADAERTLQYGIAYFDDALGGIIPHDLIFTGARSGAGKTQAAKIVGAHNARGYRRELPDGTLGPHRRYNVAGFFLEAEEGEIERRIKFELLASRWRKDHTGYQRGYMNYADWRMGKRERDLAPYKKSVEEEFQEEYKTFRTYYRIRGDFGLAELDREMYKAAEWADLFILDHIHYVDLDGSGANENYEMKKLIKKLRHIALVLGIPILGVAHLRKGASNGMAPVMDDYHGASDISKIATTCIMLAPAHGVVSCDSKGAGKPTFTRIVKNRLGGDRMVDVGLSFFDPITGMYLPSYALGHINMSNTKWTPLKTDYPFWAKEERLVTDIQEIE